MGKYELIVIGSGPCGEKAAAKAAYFGHKVALIEKESLFGGAGVLTGTLPSKTLKETALYLSGKYDKGLYGIDRDIAGETTVENFMYRKNWIIQTGSAEVEKNLALHHIDVYHGHASFLDAHRVRVQGKKEEVLEAEYILIATGSYPSHPSNIPFDKKRIHDSDSILDITRFPRSIAILGAGVIGCEYATIFSTMGTKVYLLNRSDKILTFIDQEITAQLLEHMKRDRIDLVINKAIKNFKVPATEEEAITIELETGETLNVDMFLFAAGRNGNVQGMNLEQIGVKITERQTIVVNEHYQTAIPNIYAGGDVIGFPALASTSMDQGRVAVAHMFDTKDIEHISRVLPYGIYTVPEISTAGITEEEAKQKGLSYSVGIARHRDMARGKIMGAEEGMLKLVFTTDDLIVRGVHIIGNLATELIHHGISLIEGEKSLTRIIGMVYNYPTLHDLYKYAAYDGLGNVAGHKMKEKVRAMS